MTDNINIPIELAEKLVTALSGAITEIVETGFAEGVFFGPDHAIEAKLRTAAAELQKIAIAQIGGRYIHDDPDSIPRWLLPVKP